MEITLAMAFYDDSNVLINTHLKHFADRNGCFQIAFFSADFIIKQTVNLNNECSPNAESSRRKLKQKMELKAEETGFHVIHNATIVLNCHGEKNESNLNIKSQ